MEYLYGKFTNNQIKGTIQRMHSQVHKLLVYKDISVEITEPLFNSDEEYLTYFNNILYRFGGLNHMLGYPRNFVELMATLQAAYKLVAGQHFKYKTFRKLILDAHGYISSFAEEVENNAINSNR